jgi:hypothetical protein
LILPGSRSAQAGLGELRYTVVTALAIDLRPIIGEKPGQAVEAADRLR